MAHPLSINMFTALKGSQFILLLESIYTENVMVWLVLIFYMNMSTKQDKFRKP